jgi:hypothetical protein
MPDNCNGSLSRIRDSIFWIYARPYFETFYLDIITELHCCSLQNFRDVPANTKCSLVHITCIYLKFYIVSEMLTVNLYPLPYISFSFRLSLWGFFSGLSI